MKIRPIKNLEELEQVFEQSKKDGHVVTAPTHAVMTDGGDLRGALSFIPTVLVWMDTKENGVRDSKKMLDQVEAHLGISGSKVFCMPCTEQSPYFQFMESAGFVNIGRFNLFVKGL